jgi:catechol 2,3-dioxygenase-like lactoylglutathione lyase family enzyme
LEDEAHATRTTLRHVGITVADLDTATAFFVRLCLQIEGRTFVEGEFLDTVSGIPDSRTESSCYGRPTEVPG